MRAVLLIAAFALTCCARAPQAPVDTGPAVEDVEAVLADVDAALESRDVARVMRNYSLVASISAPEQRLVAPGEIEGHYQALITEPQAEFVFNHPSITVVSSSGDLAYSWGGYHQRRADPEKHQRMYADGDYMVAFERNADGRWVIVREVRSRRFQRPEP